MLRKLVKISIVSATIISSSGFFAHNSQAEQNYCAAIRGNGDAMPAHWGAMAKIVAEKGIPSAMAGGSSASITMFLIESLSLNQFVSHEDHLKQATLIKSFQGYFEALAYTDEGEAILNILSDAPEIRQLVSLAHDLENLELSPKQWVLIKKSLSQILNLLDSQQILSLVNPEFADYVQETLGIMANAQEDSSLEILAVLNFRKSEIEKSIIDFGKFDSQNDDSLFFRPGLFNFGSLAHAFGQMGDFYASHPLADEQVFGAYKNQMKSFLSECATPRTKDLSWRQIVELKPQCQEIITQAVLKYRSSHLTSGLKGELLSRVYHPIGHYLSTFPTTSVLVGDAAIEFKEKLSRYRFNSDPNFGRDFRIHTDDLRFGYWGSEEELQNIESVFHTQMPYRIDAKSQRFLSLGDAPWLAALSTSPAEPGLSRILPIEEKYFSAGGWNDLHPTLILRAHGCDEVVYITRKGGESFFAQGVIKRLIDLDGFDWARFDGLSKDERWELNAQGVPSDRGPRTTKWSELYNMANPESSIRRSMRMADQILCTDWDRTSSRTNMNPMIEDALRSPLIGGNELCI